MSEPPARMMRLFKYDHLPRPLQRISAPFGMVAAWIARSFPDTEQTRLAMQKLVEAKDCAVRGCLDHHEAVAVFSPVDDSSDG
jgi:hypothetical protein